MLWTEICSKIRALIVHHTDLFIDRHAVEIHALDIYQVHTLETNNFRSTLCHIDNLLDQETLD